MGGFPNRSVVAHVGFRNGVSFDQTRSNWNADGARPLAWSAWYPSEAKVATDEFSSSWFVTRPVAKDAPIASSDGPLPLVLLSHGSGASAMALEWLAHRLAQCGFLALAVNHHGHTGEETEYRAEGFLCLWERARDLSALLSDRLWRQAVGGHIAEQANVAGFSAGAYTAMLLMGARVAYSQFEPDNPVKSPIKGPREFPNLVDELPKLQLNPVFSQSWQQRRGDFSDDRVGRAVVIAPGRSVLGFSLESLREIRRPIQIFGGDADKVADPQDCCMRIQNIVPNSKFKLMTGGVGHYTFLPEGSEIGVQSAPELFFDEPGIQRKILHDQVALHTMDFFDKDT